MPQAECFRPLTDHDTFDEMEYCSSDVTVNPLLEAVLADVQEAIGPLWPLKDYVAVNPFVGMTNRRFLAVREALRRMRSGDILMPPGYYRTLITKGSITTEDIAMGLQQCQSEYPGGFSLQSLDDVLDRLDGDALAQKDAGNERKFWTVSESIDRVERTSWTDAITNEVTRHCAAHYDQGQAIWSSPWKHLSLYGAWREKAKLDRRIEKLGVRGFRQFASELPATPLDAIQHAVRLLNVPAVHWHEFMLCELLSVAGWSSYVKYRVRDAEMAGQSNEDLLGLLAIRLAYDCGLVSAGLLPDGISLWPEDVDVEWDDPGENTAIGNGTLARYALQVAAETSYQRKLCSALSKQVAASQPSPSRKRAQMVFCIDVRSEVIRRHLESAGDEIQTFGFAGFFGLPFEYIPLGRSTGSSQCPVLLKPGFRIQENLRGADGEAWTVAIDRRRALRKIQAIWKSFQCSAASCFSFVESLGLTYFGKLLANVMRFTRPVGNSRFDGLSADDRARLGPVIQRSGDDGVGLDEHVALARGILFNLGLTRDFARIVVICGHESNTVNNPYKASFDCGACGGHSGESNARTAAALLNDADVRGGLSKHGIEIPNDVWFVPAVHDTPTDEIHFLDLDLVPESHTSEFEELEQWTKRAASLARRERALRMGSSPGDLDSRSRDWSEVRPEYGLAGNAAFIVAPRARTSGLKLDGRTFLHSYDFQQDPELKVLELIMTAPMVVTSWINLQYYASTVDNQAYGSGNKAIHNVVGQFGILQGNGGDLMTGLPWQSIHDGLSLTHEPLRLTVLIEAPRDAIEQIMDKHESVRNLVVNGWLLLIALDAARFFRYAPNVGWQPHFVATRE